MVEFKKVMSLMRSRNRQGASHRDGLRIGMKVSGSVEEGGLLEYFFGRDGTECLGHDKFVDFLTDLHNEVCLPSHSYPSSVCYSIHPFMVPVVWGLNRC